MLSLVCLFTVTGWWVVVQGVLMSVDNTWHANPAVPIKACATKLSPADLPRYRTFKDDQSIRTSMPKVPVHFNLQMLTGTDRY